MIWHGSAALVGKLKVQRVTNVKLNGLVFLKVSQGDATEKLAHQVTAQAAASDCWVEETSGDPHEEEKDETH